MYMTFESGCQVLRVHTPQKDHPQAPVIPVYYKYNIYTYIIIINIIMFRFPKGPPSNTSYLLFIIFM